MVMSIMSIYGIYVRVYSLGSILSDTQQHIQTLYSGLDRLYSSMPYVVTKLFLFIKTLCLANDVGSSADLFL